MADLDLDEGINIKRTLSPGREVDPAEVDRFEAFDVDNDEDDLFGNILSPAAKKARPNDDFDDEEDPFAFMDAAPEEEPIPHGVKEEDARAGKMTPRNDDDGARSVQGDHVSMFGAPATPALSASRAKMVAKKNRMTVGPQNPSFPSLMDRNMPSFKLQKEKMDDSINNAPNREDLNDFEKALIKLKGPRRGPDRMTDVLAYDEAKAIVEEMQKASQVDTDARKNGFPSLAKVMLLKKVVRLILRDKVGEQFIFVGGLLVIYEWLSNTPGVPAKFGAPVPEIVSGMLKVLERVPVKKSMLKETKIGVLVNRIWHNPKYSVEIRRSAERVCVKWLAMFQRKEDEEEQPAETLIDRSKPTADADADDLTNEVRPLIESKRDPKFWEPNVEQIYANEHSMKYQRHAMRPMEKPVFKREYLPDSMVSSKVGWNKTNPETTMGKIDRRVQQLANPNKKAWKNSLCKQVSVEGRGLH